MTVAAAAKSLQSCPTLRPHRRQPTRLPRPWDSPGKNTGVGCHCRLQCRKVKGKSLSCVRLLTTPWTAAHQAPPMGFSRQEYWSGVPLPSPVRQDQLASNFSRQNQLALSGKPFVNNFPPKASYFVPKMDHFKFHFLQRLYLKSSNHKKRSCNHVQ